MSRRAVVVVGIVSIGIAVTAIVVDLAIADGTVQIVADAALFVALVAVVVIHLRLWRIGPQVAGLLEDRRRLS
jgi:hypothetical protein